MNNCHWTNKAMSIDALDPEIQHSKAVNGHYGESLRPTSSHECKTNNELTWEQFVYRAWHSIAFYSRSLSVDRAEAEDACQDALVALWSRIHSGQSPSKASHVHYGYVHVTIIRAIRKRKRQNERTRLSAFSDEPHTARDSGLSNVNELDQWVYLANTLRKAANGLRTDRARSMILVEYVLSAVQCGNGLSLRRIGQKLWPTRPQTACERFKVLTASARVSLELRSTDDDGSRKVRVH